MDENNILLMLDKNGYATSCDFENSEVTCDEIVQGFLDMMIKQDYSKNAVLSAMYKVVLDNLETIKIQ